MAEEAKHIEEQTHRVTALLGAGVNLGLDLKFKPSTYCLTEKLVNAQYQIIDINSNQHKNSDLVQYVYQTICNNFSQGALNPATSYNIVHFEIIFHVLEVLYSYCYFSEMHNNGRSFPNEFVPPFAYFAQVNKLYSSSEINQVMKQYISILMELINVYDEEYRNNKTSGINKTYSDFWTAAEYKWDIFNLNYDTTIENSLSSYDDGSAIIDAKYTFKKFVPEQLYATLDNTVNHLHGCITYGIERLPLDEYNHNYVYFYDSDDYYRWNDFGLAFNLWKSYSRSNLFAQNHEVIFPSPIITGLNKTDKITTIPFNMYKQHFSQKLILNNALLIAGYSFGDLYLNKEMERMRLYHGDKWRVVLIDKWDFRPYSGLSKKDKVQNYIWGRKLNQDLVRLICKVAQEGQLEANIFTYNNKGYLVSKNKQLMLFVDGINGALQYSIDIYNFLQS